MAPDTDHSHPPVDPVQLKIAALLAWFVRVGVVLMVVMFAIYASGVLPSNQPIESVPDLWHLSASELSDQLQIEPGWAWLGGLDQGSNLAFAALVFFPAAALVIVGIAALFFAGTKKRIYAGIALLETVVLLVAATGIMSRLQ